MYKYSTLKKRYEFLEIRKNGKYISNKYFTLQYMLTPINDSVIVGYTVTKKLGKAVIRNKIKRRLRAAVQINFHLFTPGKFVIIAKIPSFSSEFKEITKALEDVCKKICKNPGTINV